MREVRPCPIFNFLARFLTAQNVQVHRRKFPALFFGPPLLICLLLADVTNPYVYIPGLSRPKMDDAIGNGCKNSDRARFMAS